MIFRFSEVFVTETSIVRSSRNSPSRTFSRAVTAACRMKSVASIEFRKRVRVFSIFLAAEISSSRVKSGISPICIRYIRTGSSIAIGLSPVSCCSSFSDSSSLCSTSAATTLVAFLPPKAEPFFDPFPFTGAAVRVPLAVSSKFAFLLVVVFGTDEFLVGMAGSQET